MPETTVEKELAKETKPSTPLSAETLAQTLAEPDNGDIPDLIVLGFQELDLSAGALLYSTETTREEAWFTAIMAGLGEKAELYEKVVHRCPHSPSIV